jgi:DNA-binding CsgD family transcriptional regulator
MSDKFKRSMEGNMPKALPTGEMAWLWKIPFSNETDKSKVESALRERIKELNCLYGLTKLAERHFDSIDGLLGELVNFLPYSWQYPEITCSRIIFKSKIYNSKGFKITEWRQSSPILMYNEPVGEVAMFYLEERAAADEGPFLNEERALLDVLADHIGVTAARISAEAEILEVNRQLKIERQALQESNMALRTVLSRIEDEKQEIYRNMKVNIDKILMPILHALSLEATPNLIKYVEMIRRNLDEITSPFISHLSDTFNALTPTEITICNMIRNGMQTKEIAKIRGVSPSTINRHRENIRRKLEITNRDVNLATFLQSSSWLNG